MGKGGLRHDADYPLVASGIEIQNRTLRTFSLLEQEQTSDPESVFCVRFANSLYYMRQRYYNTEIKRFINQDIVVGSIGNSQSLNRYS